MAPTRGSMVTRAKKAQNGFLLTGAKMWITNAPLADVFLSGPRMTTT